MTEREFLLKIYLSDAAYAATVGNRDLLIMCLHNAAALYRARSK
jgi:hypothetical protein